MLDGTGETAVRAVSEVIQPESRQGRGDNILVRHVHVERLVEWKLRDVVVVAGVDVGVAGVDQVRLQPGRQFKHVSNPMGPAGGGAEGAVGVVCEVGAVCVVAPFLLGEERAEGGGSERGCFVWTEVLHC